MAITSKSIKLLWAAAGGRCSYEGCWVRVSHHDSGEASPYTIGEMAHICGDKQGASRHDPKQTDVERDAYGNLMLLCPTHHALIDRPENEAAYPVDLLLDMKLAHEAKVLELLEYEEINVQLLASDILAMMEENRLSWSTYGPRSELAQKNPNDEAVHQIWTTERLSIIVPNNRKIFELLKMHRDKFSAEQMKTVATFRLHVRSYEQWVKDIIPYAGVLPFPVAFEEMIAQLAGG